MSRKKEPIRFDLEVPKDIKVEVPDTVTASIDISTPKDAPDTEPSAQMKGTEENRPEESKLDRELAEKDLRADLLNILKEPKVKGQIMGMVDFHPATPDGHLKWRHIMVDVSEDVFFRAWERYKQDHPVNPSAEAFIFLVFNIMDTELPRLHKDIWHGRLE